jgi:predicted TPR repeat methyltransferase
LLAEDPVAHAEDLISQGRAREAAVLLKDMLEARRGGLLLRLTLQKAVLEAGDTRDALLLARETALTHPGVALAALSLGEALQALGHLPTAIGEYQRALRLDPQLDVARAALGAAWLDAGEAEKALEAWRGIADESALQTLAGKIADAERARSEPRSDPRFVRHLFDQFSADYDSRMLDQLGYQAPALLRELATFLGLDAKAPCAILDLGCGTGLMGEAVRDWASRLDGVDLSPSMLAKAAARAIYDELVVADICAWLAEPGRDYDLVFAGDTLVYLGDLGPLFARVAARLARGGNFLFTVESHDGEGFELGPKRRWLHSERYLRAEAARAGLAVAGLMPCAPRKEAGLPVGGLAVALSKA